VVLVSWDRKSGDQNLESNRQAGYGRWSNVDEVDVRRRLFLPAVFRICRTQLNRDRVNRQRDEVMGHQAIADQVLPCAGSLRRKAR